MLTIAKGQIELEEKAIQQLPFTIHHSSLTTRRHSLLFIDTDMYVMKVWAEFVFSKCHNWILNKITERSYDLYLLCDIDLPWVEDALREYPDKKIREKLFSFYKDLMINQSTPWHIVSGNYEERLEKAKQIIDTSFT